MVASTLSRAAGLGELKKGSGQLQLLLRAILGFVSMWFGSSGDGGTRGGVGVGVKGGGGGCRGGDGESVAGSTEGETAGGRGLVTGLQRGAALYFARLGIEAAR